jgi:hypothetical protein
MGLKNLEGSVRTLHLGDRFYITSIEITMIVPIQCRSANDGEAIKSLSLRQCQYTPEKRREMTTSPEGG